LIFSRKESKRLPSTLARRLQPEAAPSESAFLGIEQLQGGWADVRERVLGKEFHCVILATDHDEFLDTYEELMLNTPTPIADLRNAIATWFLSKQKPSKDVIEQVRQKLADPKKYMLLGVN
jgi:hypothetical protein